MAEIDSQYGKYHVTGRLFNLINTLPPDKQFILYKQLIKGNVTTELFRLIIEMSEEQKLKLLEQLGELPYEEEPVRTIDLDIDESFMRENPRKICLIPVRCAIDDRSFKSYIIDISTLGAFIETSDPFTIGQKMEMTFKLPNYSEPFKINGSISRSGPKGIGIKFYGLTQSQEEFVRSFIESKQ